MLSDCRCGVKVPSGLTDEVGYEYSLEQSKRKSIWSFMGNDHQHPAEHISALELQITVTAPDSSCLLHRVDPWGSTLDGTLSFGRGNEADRVSSGDRSWT